MDGREHDEGGRNNEEGRGCLSYRDIEKKRKEMVSQHAYRLLQQREMTNKSIEQELSKYTQKEAILNNLGKSVENSANEVESCGPAIHIDDDSQNSQLMNEKASDEHKSVESITALDGRQDCCTNIVFSNEFISRFILNRKYVEIEESICREKLMMPRSMQIQIKMQINKRLSQVSGNAGQVDKIFNVLREYSNSYLFIETFVLKLIEQGRIQVSSCPGSYREFSALFCKFFTVELMEYFRVVLFTMKATIGTIRGMYGIYFGVLEMLGEADEAWFFIASVLNSEQNEMSCYVIECFFSILGGMLFVRCRGPFIKLVDYTKKYYMRDMNNEPCKIRMLSILEKYDL
ncbi:hypothetical protein M896_021620 [Ordospora colligata OC4]|uniref:Uncharacterized protein n=1 Tax=Ordospora colligata OC4 TaxID=1354746 RepID=A0A0B2ULW9_9MICR|nr:uncharacterized protein M896_021620 [Ordospora colligata OC4]KHN70323.1 hypothetical protein M896_021620 [Ordospora colligata OC4]TBU16867.1 hypothetical protein CWI41_021630 [Ordospora colligata]